MRWHCLVSVLHAVLLWVGWISVLLAVSLLLVICVDGAVLRRWRVLLDGATTTTHGLRSIVGQLLVGVWRRRCRSRHTHAIGISKGGYRWCDEAVLPGLHDWIRPINS